ncbi:MAG: hypothetical protein ACJZ8O_08005 [Pirellulaceae bacterium]
MVHQIIYTSVPRGLAPGSKGYCTVVASNGMAPALQRQLEALSHYDHIHPPNTANDGLNPTNFQYSKTSFGGKQLYVLTRVSDAGLDYSRRSNLLAHHVALEPDECNVAGPAALLESLLLPPTVKKWEKPPQRLDIPSIPNLSCPTSPMMSHSSLGVKPELVGEIAGRLINSTQQIVTVLYRQEQHSHLLALVTDVFWLLAPRDRWNTTFSTYYSADVQNTDCRLRFIPHGTPNAERALLDPGTIDLDQNMTVLDSEMVRAAREAAKTGNRTLAHPRAAESGHTTGESFARAQPQVNGPRPPIGGPDLRLQPPPIAGPATQGLPNQGLPNQGLPNQGLPNQDRHSSRARKKLVIAISIVTVFLLLGIIAAVLLNNIERDSREQVSQSGGDNTGKQLGNSTSDNSGNDGTSKDNQNHGNSNSDASNQDRHESTNENEDGNQDSHDMVGGEGANGGESTQESIKQVRQKTSYKVDLKRKEEILESIDQLRSGQDFSTQVSENDEDFLQICNMRIVLLKPNDSDLVVTQEDDAPNVAVIGLDQDGARELLTIALTDDPKNQLSWTWNKALDDMADQKARLKNALSDELIKTVLIIPYRKDAEVVSGFDSKVRMRILRFGTELNQSLSLSAFPDSDDGYEVPDEAAMALVTAIDSASSSQSSTLKVSGQFPRYDLTAQPMRVAYSRPISDFKKLENGHRFEIKNFWGEPNLEKEEKEKNYVPRIDFEFNISDQGQIRYGFPVTAVIRKQVTDQTITSDVFAYLDGLSAKDYVWVPTKYIQEPAPKNEKQDQKAQREARDRNRREEESQFHRRFAIKMGRAFLQLKPTTHYEQKRVAISQSQIKDWKANAVSFKLIAEAGSEPSTIKNLKDLININERLLNYLPDFSKAVGRNSNLIFEGDFSMWIVRKKDGATAFGEEYKRELTGYKGFLSNQFKLDEFDPMKLQPLIFDLTSWAKTLHGLTRINEHLERSDSKIQLQIEIQRTFDLSSALKKGSSDEIKMAKDPQHDENGEFDLVVTIFQIGSTTLNNAN